MVTLENVIGKADIKLVEGAHTSEITCEVNALSAASTCSCYK